MTTAATTIRFSALMYKLGPSVILRLPERESEKLPSRGQVAVTGTINGYDFRTIVLEPDGYWGHWMRLSDELQKVAPVGSEVAVEVTPTKSWPEPVLPADFQKVLTSAPQKVKDKWADITPMARWEWIRWINSTGRSETRTIRLEKTVSKLNGTHRRPCCFNLAACTDPELSKSGRLMGVDKTV